MEGGGGLKGDKAHTPVSAQTPNTLSVASSRSQVRTGPFSGTPSAGIGPGGGHWGAGAARSGLGEGPRTPRPPNSDPNQTSFVTLVVDRHAVNSGLGVLCNISGCYPKREAP